VERALVTADGSDLSGMPDVQLVRELFPFCFTVDHDMRLAMVGTRWATFDPAVRPGADFHGVFAIERPTGVRDETEITARAGDVFLLALRGREGFHLRGQFVPRSKCSCGGCLLFVGGPWITRVAEMQRFGLGLSDFPPHDPRGDFLVVLQTQESTLVDMKELAKARRWRRSAASPAASRMTSTTSSWRCRAMWRSRSPAWRRAIPCARGSRRSARRATAPRT